MNRARDEILSLASKKDAHVELLEREAARRRWRSDLELDVLTLRNEAASLRRESERR
jgi:hypothetical protein